MSTTLPGLADMFSRLGMAPQPYAGGPPASLPATGGTQDNSYGDLAEFMRRARAAGQAAMPLPPHNPFILFPNPNVVDPQTGAVTQRPGFTTSHPALAHLIEGGLAGAMNVPPPTGPEGAGAGISRALQGGLSPLLMQRQQALAERQMGVQQLQTGAGLLNQMGEAQQRAAQTGLIGAETQKAQQEAEFMRRFGMPASMMGEVQRMKAQALDHVYTRMANGEIGPEQFADAVRAETTGNPLIQWQPGELEGAAKGAPAPTLTQERAVVGGQVAPVFRSKTGQLFDANRQPLDPSKVQPYVGPAHVEVGPEGQPIRFINEAGQPFLGTEPGADPRALPAMQAHQAAYRQGVQDRLNLQANTFAQQEKMLTEHEQVANRKVVNALADKASETDAMARVSDSIIADIEKRPGQKITGPEFIQLMANHVGSTTGQVPGFRQTQALVQDLVTARPWDQGLQAMWNKITAGGDITLDQAKQWAGIAKDFRRERWNTVKDEAARRGITDIQLPKDLQGGAAGPSGGGGAATHHYNPATGQIEAK